MSYIGNDLRSGRSETYVFTASGDETTVTASDDSRAINYTVGWERVWLNGVLLVGGSGNDYQATTGNSITGLAALSPNDILVLEANHTFSVSDSVPRSGGTFDGAVIFDGSIQQKTTTQNLSGTYSTEQLFLNDSYTLTGDITVSGHLVLGTLITTDVEIINDLTVREITGDGVLECGAVLGSNPPVNEWIYEE